MAFNNETDKIILELTLDELKLIDKYVELNEETESVFDKIKYAYPQLKMTLQQEGDYAVVSYNDTTYYRLMGETTFCWYIKKGVSANYHTPTLVMVIDGETERLLEGLYYNYIEVKKEKEMIRQNLKTSLEELANGDVRPIDDVIEEAKEEQTKTPCEIAYKDWRGIYPGTGTWDSFDATRWIGFEAGYNAAYKQKAQERGERVHNEMEETIKIHDGYGVVDYQPTPQTHEQVADGLKEAFREAQQTEKWKEIQNKIDGGDFDNFIEKTKLLDFLRDKLGYSTDSCYEIVDAISEWLPEEQIANSQNTYVELTVEGWNDCINFIRGKLQ